MGIQTELTRITNAKTAIKTAIEGKGVTVPAGTLLDGMASLIESIEAGGGGGGYEVTCGVVTPAEDSATISWEHGLSKVPSFVLIFLPLGWSYKTHSNSLRAYYKKYYYSTVRESWDSYITTSSASYLEHPNSMAAGQSAFSIDATTVTANACSFSAYDNTNMIWLSGKPYFWICIAGDIVFPQK